ncbi:hypothetical protein M413DRAFT_356741 [Hebeloma cylindrosporum]|uniref:Tetratricopeptide SHNi-TPR domain-containing protein n=1 Tax=Hebeloma cylindrosporum TaxID=76867 RepID=A0A0C3CKF8_HEBCY|nr:hypothetical protein M413DRAFT_356741 [Hebeloma cylindrosporum h7]
MTSNAPAVPNVTVETSVEHAKRAFALRKYEQAIGHYATALELATKQLGENAPEIADLYFSYGKALLENAIVQSSVLGKEQPEEAAEEAAQVSGSGVGASGPILSFTGDMEDDGEDHPIDLFGQASAEQDGEDDSGGEGEGEEDDGEPEDDFNAAWEVLDLARAIYEKQKEEDGDEEVNLKLADTFIALGDVSLETEKFDQAITDYEAGLGLKVELLPISSRQIAEAHYKLSMVLDLTSGRLSDAIVHAIKALESVESRLAELRNGLEGKLPPLPVNTKDTKGKGKSTTRLIRDDYVQNMSKNQIEGEIKELSGLRDDLALKVEELKTSPNESLATSAPALAAQALDRELNAGGSSSASKAAPAIVNDLTSIVKKKKKVAPEDPSAGKRKAESEAEPTNADKKVKLDTPDA